MNFCKHCKFLEDDAGDLRCLHPRVAVPVIDRVHGPQIPTVNPLVARYKDDLCGRNGIYFSPRLSRRISLFIKSLFITSGTIFLLGCDSVVSETPLATRTISKSVSCIHPGFCYHPATRFGYNPVTEKYEQSIEHEYGFYAACPGMQVADVEIRSFRRLHESGKTSVREVEIVKNTLTPCE